MATSKSQRAAIWVIAAMMAVGSIGFYFLIIIENNNAAQQQADLQRQLQASQQKQPLPGYEAEPFEADEVAKLVKQDIKKGTGKTVPEGATVRANYMGWLPDGTIFDSSNGSGEPSAVEFSLAQVIVGWQEGVPGMREGGVRKLVIPAEQAYGADGQPAGGIAPNTPLTFIVQLEEVVSE